VTALGLKHRRWASPGGNGGIRADDELYPRCGNMGGTWPHFDELHGLEAVDNIGESRAPTLLSACSKYYASNIMSLSEIVIVESTKY
jgi:hypothetical protein